MPARGRNRRKSGQMRADAALDAMRAYGFPDRLIRQTLKELLQVYGEDGWFLIEDASYKVLLEAILEKVEKEEQEQKEKTKDGRTEIGSTSKLPADANPDGQANLATEMGRQASQPPAHIDPDGQATEMGMQTDQIDATSVSDEMVVNSPAHYSEQGGWLDPDSPEVEESSEKKERKDMTMGEVIDGDNAEMKEEDGHITLAGSVKPCYGWISSEEEDEEDYVARLTPEPLPENLRRLLMEADRQRKRKRRWDVRPEELSKSRGT